MSSNPEQILQQLQHDFYELVTIVTSDEKRTAYNVEYQLFSRLLRLGKQLLLLFFVTRASVRPEAPMTTGGQVMRCHDRRYRSYYSVFGKLTFRRHYFHHDAEEGVCPLDAELQLPATCYSDLLREWATMGAVECSYRTSCDTLSRILELPLSCQALEMMMAEDRADVEAFYQQLGASSTVNDASQPASLLVVQADGKGIPMVSAHQQRAVRLGKGQKRTSKKEAIVTALYTIAPYPRTADEVSVALLRDDEKEPSVKRPRPEAKELRGSLAGKETAIMRLAQRAALRDTGQIQAHVALTDGAEALQKQMLSQFPHYTLVLDIIHASEYLWKCATAVLGETHPQRSDWVREHLKVLLEGDTARVIASLEKHLPQLSPAQSAIVKTTIGYYQRNAPYMRYDQYLAEGYPIGTGVVEAACGHLVKDRLDCSGMRWTVAGAQAVMDLRAVQLSRHWDHYWQFHRQQTSHRLYGKANPNTSIPAEMQLLPLAA